LQSRFPVSEQGGVIPLSRRPFADARGQAASGDIAQRESHQWQPLHHLQDWVGGEIVVCFWRAKRLVILSDYRALMVEILKDNARPEAGPVYGAIDMSWTMLVGQIAKAYGK
jgi:hypothetical protein